MSIDLRIGDCRKILPTLADKSVHCCVTSPPYFGLRDYGVDGQIGLEPTPDAFVAELVLVFAEVRRVLRDDGTLWLNLGDSYARDAGKGQHKPGDAGKQNYIIERGNGRAASTISKLGSSDGAVGRADRPGSRAFGNILKPKDLIGIPWRVAFALQADGWYLRQDIIWSKPNPMPESVTDRCTKAHEYIFLLSKSARYHYDAEAIKEKVALSSMARVAQNDGNPVWNGDRNRGSTQNPQTIDITKMVSADGMRNKRSVWEIVTTPYSQAHFATFPPALIEPCILAGCPAGGTVLDPFGGAGTTGMVADRLGRNAILIELNAEYAQLTNNRIQDDAGLFAEVNIT